MGKSYNYLRKETRFSHEGVVFLHTTKGAFKARGRDLSQNGIGIEFLTKLKGYRLGAEVELEFAEPNHLRGLKIRVQLRRVNTDGAGHDHCGFVIVDDNQMVKRRVSEIVSFYDKMPRR